MKITRSVFVAAVLGIVLSTTAFAAPKAAARQSRFRKGVEVRSSKAHKVVKSLPRGDFNPVKEDGKTVYYPKKSQVDFDGSLIEGELRNPSEFYFVHRPEEKFGTLVKKRKNFHKEMLRDTVMVR